MKKTLEVKTGTDEYKILIGDNILLSSGSLIKKKLINPRVFIITNKLIYKLYGKKLENSLKKNKISFNKIIINDGEKYKNIKTINLITSKLLKYKVDRNDTLIAFGGGVIGDIVGFSASITLRGINFIQIPTTLLSQVDSAVGGKTGVNTKEGKNLIGTFYQPKLVISDVSLLKSLPKREILSGYAEIIKYGLIMDKRFLNWLLDNESKLMTFNKKYLIEAVFHSCKNKAIIVRKDEKEKNIRAILNLGHTFGHAIEAINNYQKSLTHGEAVSIGILMALDMSSLQGNSLNKNINKIKDHFQKLKMKTKIPNNIKRKTSLKKFKETMNSDKKVKNNHINLILLRNLGKAYLANRYSNRKLDSVINEYINSVSYTHLTLPTIVCV